MWLKISTSAILRWRDPLEENFTEYNSYYDRDGQVRGF
jgi:hypothetical protein